MSYALSGPLQAAVYGALTSSPVLSGLVGTHIYDALPVGEMPETYVSLGDERVRDASDVTGAGALHRLEIFVRTTRPGFAFAKAVSGAVCDVLNDADLTLSRGRLVFLRFERAETRRIDSMATRQILMRFKARVDDQ